jgi:peroxiredoxin
MRLPIIFFVLCSLFGVQIGLSQVVISGKQHTYANSELHFKTFADPFTGAENDLGTCLVSDSGAFLVRIPINETRLVFLHLGVFKGFIYIEPGKNYEILLPDKTDKTNADKLNPYFEETEFHIATKNLKTDDINFQIRTFDDMYQPYQQKFLTNIYARNKAAMLDTTILKLKRSIPENSTLFFKNYVAYKIGYLQNLTLKQKSKSISINYFEHKPVLFYNPAYINLFNQVYTKYFYYFGMGANGKYLVKAINEEQSLSKLNQALLLDSVLQNDTLRELVILKNIHDEFYSSNFLRSGLLIILDSLKEQTLIANNRTYATFIKEKITRLMPGFEPPDFTLYDKEKKLHKLSELKGKYVYLNFCNCASYSCIKEFGQLKRISEKYSDKLVVVTVSFDETFESMAEYVNKSEYNWLFLYYGNQPDIVEKFDIRAFPCYYLIGTDGKLIQSPAKSPAESFELDLFNILRSRKEI